MADVLILGGGLAGLTAAFRLLDHCNVRVLEGAARVGGQIDTTSDEGFLIERGAEGFVARSTAVPALARDLGMQDELIGQAIFGSYGFDGTRLAALTAGEAAQLLGFQVPAEDLGKGIRSLRRGMGSLIDALHDRVKARATLDTSCRALSVTVDAARVRVQTQREQIACDALIVALPAANAASLLAPLVGSPAQALQSAATLSSVTVELAYRRDAVPHPLDATGFVVAAAAQEAGLRACTFTSAKFADRSPAGKTSLRVFFRPSTEDLAALSDEAWAERATEGLKRILAVQEPPLHAWVSRWPAALPIFGDGHRAQVAALEAALAPYPVALAGSAFHGAGIDAAVGSAEQAARAILARI